MAQIIIQYALIVLLVTGLGYLVYLLKDKDVDIKDDYFGLANIILGSLISREATPENVKKILRVISDSVRYVEANYRNSENAFKEEEAIRLAKDATSLLNFESKIDSESLKYLIRLAAALLPPTNKEYEVH